MAALSGTYILSGQEKKGDQDVNPDLAAARVLKLLGDRPQSFGSILSSTGFAEPVLRAAIDDLRRRDLLTGNDGELTLTPQGYKAHFIVAS